MAKKRMPAHTPNGLVRGKKKKSCGAKMVTTLAPVPVIGFLLWITFGRRGKA